MYKDSSFETGSFKDYCPLSGRTQLVICLVPQPTASQQSFEVCWNVLLGTAFKTKWTNTHLYILKDNCTYILCGEARYRSGMHKSWAPGHRGA